tara:strand:+ start:95 stop:1255 length:1161 start_codon:yes stop_codon:yes gene_type:complete
MSEHKIAAELRELASLKDEGILTDEEFEKKKQELLNLKEPYTGASQSNITQSATDTNKQYDLKEVRFEGNASEFFRIWIVNLFLSLITFGIYSPWAKVQNTKYLYQNLVIDGHRFNYIADPIQILKGRILAVFLLVIYLIATSYNFALSILFPIILFLMAPWIINRSMSFQMRMTTYRNVRFNFEGDYGNSFLYFLLLPALTYFTLFLALPLVLKNMNEYILNKTKYGDRYFTSNLSTSEFYKTYGIVVGVSIGVVLLILIISLISETIGTILIFPAYILIIAVSAAIVGVMIRNHTYNNTILSEVASFESSMQIKPYTFIVFTNILALIFSFGLAYPWVMIRNTKYLASTVTVKTEENIDSVIDTISKSDSAILDEVAGAFDLEI